jgi:hypothetical protein
MFFIISNIYINLFYDLFRKEIALLKINKWSFILIYHQMRYSICCYKIMKEQIKSYNILILKFLPQLKK